MTRRSRSPIVTSSSAPFAGCPEAPRDRGPAPLRGPPLDRHRGCWGPPGYGSVAPSLRDTCPPRGSRSRWPRRHPREGRCHMSGVDRTDALIAEWLWDGPTEASERLIEAVLGGVGASSGGSATVGGRFGFGRPRVLGGVLAVALLVAVASVTSLTGRAPAGLDKADPVESAVGADLGSPGQRSRQWMDWMARGSHMCQSSRRSRSRIRPHGARLATTFTTVRRPSLPSKQRTGTRSSSSRSEPPEERRRCHAVRSAVRVMPFGARPCRARTSRRSSPRTVASWIDAVARGRTPRPSISSWMGSRPC